MQIGQAGLGGWRDSDKVGLQGHDARTAPLKGRHGFIVVMT